MRGKVLSSQITNYDTPNIQWSEPLFRQIFFVSGALVEGVACFLRWLIKPIRKRQWHWQSRQTLLVFGSGWFCEACRAMRISLSCSMRQRSNLSTPTRQAVRHSGQLRACLSQVSMGISHAFRLYFKTSLYLLYWPPHERWPPTSSS